MVVQHMDRLQVKVVLLESDPPIWRRLEIPADASLEELHGLIQIAMGWDNDHPFAFIYGRQGRGQSGFGRGKNWIRSQRLRLRLCLSSAVMNSYTSMTLGDSWIHRIKVEKRLSSSELVAVRDAPQERVLVHRRTVEVSVDTGICWK